MKQLLIIAISIINILFPNFSEYTIIKTQDFEHEIWENPPYTMELIESTYNKETNTQHIKLNFDINTETWVVFEDTLEINIIEPEYTDEPFGCYQNLKYKMIKNDTIENKTNYIIDIEAKQKIEINELQLNLMMRPINAHETEWFMIDINND